LTDLGTQRWRHLLGVALPPSRPVPAADAPGPQVVQHQQRADAVDVRRALAGQPLQFPIDSPCVFFDAEAKTDVQ